MAFKMKGFRKPSSLRKVSSEYPDADGDGIPDYIDSDTESTPYGPENRVRRKKQSGAERRESAISEHIDYAKSMKSQGLGAYVTGFGPIHWLRMQKKWGKFARGFGGSVGGRNIPMDASPEQRVQKMIGDELNIRATRAVIDTSEGTRAGVAAQGVAYEKIYNSPQFQSYMAKALSELEQKGGDPRKIQTDLWEGWDYPMGKSNFQGGIITGDELTSGGVSEERERWKEGMGFRQPTAKELERYESRTGRFHPGDPNKARKEVAAFMGAKNKEISQKSKDKVQKFLDSEEGEDIV